MVCKKLNKILRNKQIHETHKLDIFKITCSKMVVCCLLMDSSSSVWGTLSSATFFSPSDTSNNSLMVCCGKESWAINPSKMYSNLRFHCENYIKSKTYLLKKGSGKVSPFNSHISQHPFLIGFFQNIFFNRAFTD